MKKMIKKYIFVVVYFLLNVCTYSQILPSKSDVHIDIFPFMKILYGNINESLYYSKLPNQKCSHLEWEQKPVFLLGIGFNFIYKNSILCFDTCTGLPLGCGDLRDSDWNGNNIKTTYSISESNINNYFSANLYYKYKFVIDKMKILPVAGIDYSYRTMSARNAEGWYGQSEFSTDGKDHSWDSEYAKHFPDGKYKLAGIDYRNYIVSTFIGIQYIVDIVRNISVGMDFLVSPYAYTFRKDHHLGNGGGVIQYSQCHCVFNHFKASVFINYKINNILGLTASIFGNYMLPTKGDCFDEEMFISPQKTEYSEWNINSVMAVIIYLK